MGFKFSLVIPINLIMGREIKTEEVPVTANTIKTEIYSHLCAKPHFFSNFLNKNKINFNKIKKTTVVIRVI